VATPTRCRARPTALKEIIAELRQADVLVGEGKKVAEVAKTHGGQEVTHYRWRKEYRRPR
jgi:transposase-like protein